MKKAGRIAPARAVTLYGSFQYASEDCSEQTGVVLLAVRRAEQRAESGDLVGLFADEPEQKRHARGASQQ